ncbi:putative secretion system protein [Aliivibrio wodanis]|uniref:Putative secretion system protein n=1 Tax=Aliivibrio wodanis TaxID=80852 RepID=A0A090I7G0_9GAMM|nr:putative secretion system protein [Aliivibrio wodanis]
MYKRIIYLLSLSLLIGCSSKEGLQEFHNKETMLMKANNYQQLIPLYKNKLIEKEDDEIRLKLAKAYLKSGDPESSLFTVVPLVTKKNAKVDAFIIQANSEYELGELDQAMRTAKIAENMNLNNPDIENLLGVIYSAQHDYIKAREYFTLARTHLYDDIKIKNNLAVLDIIDGDYKKAVQRLLPIYLNNQSDDQVEANLLLAMAKLGNYNYVQSLLADKYSEREIIEKYIALKGISTISIKDTELLSDKNTVVGE